jgi:vancomycin resistance protein YoaR
MNKHYLKKKKQTFFLGISIVVLVVAYGVFYLYVVSNKHTDTVADMSVSPIEKINEADVLGRAELSYAGGTVGRNKNIEIGATRIDGTIIRPQEEFSFIRALGEVTEEGGYANEKVFLNGEVTKGIGGGLCQVSTTLFRSVLQAGLPVTERHNHSYTVSRYDIGLDATYSDPGVDFKFVNDMKYPVVLHATTTGQKVIIELRGVSDARVSSTTEPVISRIVDVPPTRYVATSTTSMHGKCLNTPQIGYTAQVNQKVLYATGVKKERVFSSTYKPLQRVCYTGETTTETTQF